MVDTCFFYSVLLIAVRFVRLSVAVCSTVKSASQRQKLLLKTFRIPRVGLESKFGFLHLRNNFCCFVDFRFCDFNSQDFNLFPVLLPFLPKGERTNRRYSTMKEFQKGILDNDKVISAENVQRMGEIIALCAAPLKRL